MKHMQSILAGIACTLAAGMLAAQIVAAADEHGIAMVFTGKRQFRH